MPAFDRALWSAISPLFDKALDLEGGDRANFLASVRADSPTLAATLQQLLDEHERIVDTEFLENSPDVDPGCLVLSGQRIGAYTLEQPLGSGGMGTVWLGRRSDGRFDGVVAIKLLHLALLDRIGQERFRREGTLLARLSHPNIARLLDAGITPAGQSYLVLEHVAGVRIDRFAAEHRLDVEARVRLWLQVADAVAHAHANLVVHRDLKPSNILVDAAGHAKLLDFGIATLLDESTNDRSSTVTLDRPLTPEYAAPEQAQRAVVTTAADVYALGVLLYQLLVGRHPTAAHGATDAAILRALLEDEPPRPSDVARRIQTTDPDGMRALDERATTRDRLRRACVGDLDTIVGRALKKTPAERYTTVTAFADDLRRYLRHEPVLARPDATWYRTRRFIRRHRAGVAVAGLLLALLAAGVIRERTLRTRAEAEASKARAVEDYLVNVFDVADPFSPPAVRGDDVTARTLLDRGAVRIERSLTTQPEVQAELRGVLGNVYANLGLLETAEPLLRRSLEQQRALHGARHAGVAAAMDRLGTLLLTQSRFDDAEPLLREALAQRRALLGNRHADTADSLDHLATLFQERTRYDAAEVLFREAIDARRAVYGSDHEKVATSLNNLGLLLHMKSRADQTERMYREALGIYVRRLGENHPLTAQTLHNLAQVLEESGRFDEAEVLYRRALAAKRKALGNAHPSVTVNLNNLANLLAVEQGKVEEAESLAREALALDRQMFKEPHAYIAESLRRLGMVLRLKGDFDEAARTYREALAMNRALFGAEHLRIASTLNHLGLTLEGQDDVDGAIALFRESLAQYRRLLGERHVNYITVNNNLARALRERGRAAEAEGLFRAAINGVDSTRPDQRAQLIAAHVGLGLALVDQGRSTEAVPLLERALDWSRGRYDPSDWRFGEVQLALAIARGVSGQRTQAEPMLREAAAKILPQRRAQPRLALLAERELALTAHRPRRVSTDPAPIASQRP